MTVGRSPTDPAQMILAGESRQTLGAGRIPTDVMIAPIREARIKAGLVAVAVVQAIVAEQVGPGVTADHAGKTRAVRILDAKSVLPNNRFMTVLPFRMTSALKTSTSLLGLNFKGFQKSWLTRSLGIS